MPTIYSIDANGRERYDTVAAERVAEIIKRRQNEGALKVKVLPNEPPPFEGTWEKLSKLKI